MKIVQIIFFLFLISSCLQPVTNTRVGSISTGALQGQLNDINTTFVTVQSQNTTAQKNIETIVTLQSHLAQILGDQNSSLSFEEVQAINQMNLDLQNALIAIAQNNLALGDLKNKDANLLAIISGSQSSLKGINSAIAQDQNSINNLVAAQNNMIQNDQNIFDQNAAYLNEIQILYSNLNDINSDILAKQDSIQRFNQADANLILTLNQYGGDQNLANTMDACAAFASTQVANVSNGFQSSVNTLIAAIVPLFRQLKCQSYYPITIWSNGACSLNPITINYTAQTTPGTGDMSQGGFWYGSTTLRGDLDGESSLVNNYISCRQPTLVAANKIDTSYSGSPYSVDQTLVGAGFYAGDVSANTTWASLAAGASLVKTYIATPADLNPTTGLSPSYPSYVQNLGVWKDTMSCTPTVGSPGVYQCTLLRTNAPDYSATMVYSGCTAASGCASYTSANLAGSGSQFSAPYTTTSYPPVFNIIVGSGAISVGNAHIYWNSSLPSVAALMAPTNPTSPYNQFMDPSIQKTLSWSATNVAVLSAPILSDGNSSNDKHSVYFQDPNASFAMSSSFGLLTHPVAGAASPQILRALFCGRANVPLFKPGVAPVSAKTQNFEGGDGGPIAPLSFGSYAQCPSNNATVVGAASLISSEVIDSAITGMCVSTVKRANMATTAGFPLLPSLGTVVDGNSTVCEGGNQSIQCSPLQSYLKIDPYDCYVVGTTAFNDANNYQSSISYSSGVLSSPMAISSPVTVRSLRYVRNNTLGGGTTVPPGLDFGSPSYFPTDPYVMVGVCVSGPIGGGIRKCLGVNNTNAMGFSKGLGNSDSSVLAYVSSRKDASGNLTYDSNPYTGFRRFLFLGSEIKFINTINTTANAFTPRGTVAGNLNFGYFGSLSLATGVQEISPVWLGAPSYVGRLARFCKVSYNNSVLKTSGGPYSGLIANTAIDFGITFLPPNSPIAPLLTLP